ncbi:hypothetical protein HELRODRAFT_166233 [Helobdella robusta]|uniref:MARVEL domain-containing protein n=1 Tax=Helobdella robusta TaxID=6412 RepID=T1EXX5_HELRO|nr:hypothetical protein HELRODRAFT_166233 [Helobdella robusta]ESN90553.1 hypothetical protein HELRODRAFT_166233 [Helobdella robusta]
MDPQAAPRQTLQKDYIKSFLGICKIAQIILSIMTFAFSSSCPWGSLGGGWVGFVSMTGFINAVIYFVLHLFNTIPPVFVNYFVELISYAIFTLFFFIAGIVAAAKGHLDGLIVAAAIFCFGALVAFLMDTVIQGLEVNKAWRERNARRAVPTSEPAHI